MKKKGPGGYLTIYITLSLTVMISLCLTLIEGARRNCIRLETECIMDIGMSSIMAEYHKELLRQYNLFYIDSSYGSVYPSYYNTEARLRHYLEKNIELEDVSYLDFVYKDFLGMELESVFLTEVALATDGEGRFFQKSAAEAVWNDSGMQLAENVLDWVGIINSNGLLERDIQKEKQAVDEELASYDGTEKELSKKKWYTVEINNPTKHMDEMRAQGILCWVLEDGAVVSGQQIDLTQYISARKRRGEINCGNVLQIPELSTLEQVLFHEYLIRYSGHYGKLKQGSVLQYQTEYLLAGYERDADNLQQVALTISGLREVANVIYLYGCTTKMSAVKGLANILAGLIFSPELAPLFEATIVMGWAYLESVYDTKVLLAGGKIPLLKTDADWHYDLDSIFTSVKMDVKKKNVGGLSYEDYLRVLLYLADQEKITNRFMDLMEMDIRKVEGNSTFRMDSCIGRIKAEAVVRSGYGYQYIVEREKSY